MIWATWVTRSIMSEPWSEPDTSEMVFIGIFLEGFCYGEIFFLLIIGLTRNYSCALAGLYSAVFCMYMQYHALKELGIDKKNILLYALCILYILSTAIVVLDATRHVAVSKTCIHYDRILLFTPQAGPLSESHPPTPPSLYVSHNKRLV